MLRISTDLGDLALTASLSAAMDRPAVFVVLGLFAPPRHLEYLHRELGAADVVVASLPATNSPALSVRDLRAWHGAYRQAVQRLFPGRRLTVVGISAGSLVALGLKDMAETMVLAEPFLRPSENQPLRELLTEALGSIANPEVAPIISAHVRDVMGIGDGAPVRDYSDLLDPPPRNLHVMVGSEQPAGPARVGSAPSLVTRGERAMWERVGRVYVVKGRGHDVTGQPLVELLRRVLAKT